MTVVKSDTAFCELILHNQENYIELKFGGELKGDISFLKRIFDEVNKLKKKHSINPILINIQDARRTTTQTQSIEIGNNIKEFYIKKTTKIAIVYAKDNHDQGFFTMVCKIKGYSVKAFFSDSEALEWFKGTK